MIDEGGLTSLATLERETMERHKQEHVRAVEEALRPHSSRQAELVAKQGQRLKDLQAQVSELLRFKEETFNQRAEMSVLQGKLREKESEARTMQNSIQDILSRTDDVHLKLHDKCARLERQRDTFAKQAGDHEHDLLAHIEALQQDNKRQAETNGILQQKLSAAEREAQHQLSHGKSSTQRLDSLLADVKAENETLRQQLAASEATARNEESSSRQVSEEASRQQKVITQLTTEISDLRAFHNEQRSLIGELSASVAALTDKSVRLQAENEVIPALRSEISSLLHYKGETSRLRKDAAQYAEEAEREKNGRLIVADEHNRLKSIVASLEDELHVVSTRTSGVAALEAELRDKKAVVETLKHDLQRESGRASSLQRKLDAVCHQLNDDKAAHGYAISEIEAELKALERVLCATNDGSKLALNELKDTAFKSKSIGTTTRETLSGLRASVEALCAIAVRLRGEAEQATETHTRSEKAVEHLSREHRDTVTELEGAQAERQRLAKRARAAEEERKRLATRLDLANAELQQLAAKLDERSVALNSIVQRTAEAQRSSLAQTGGKFAVEGYPLISGPPPDSRPRPSPRSNLEGAHAPVISHFDGDAGQSPGSAGLSFDAVQFAISDFATAAVQFMDRQHRKIAWLADRNDDLQHALSEQRGTVLQCQEEVKKVLGLADAENGKRIDRIRSELTRKHREEVDAAVLQLRASQEKLAAREADVAGLAAELDDKAAALARKDAQTASLRAACDELETDVSRALAEGRAIRLSKEDAQRTSRKAAEDNDRLLHETQRLGRKLAKTSAELKDAQADKAELLSRTAALTKQLASATSEATRGAESDAAARAQLLAENGALRARLVEHVALAASVAAAFVPLHDGHAELLFQKRAAAAEAKLHQQAVAILDSCLHSALRKQPLAEEADEAASQPFPPRLRPSMRSVVHAVMWAHRVARFACRPARTAVSDRLRFWTEPVVACTRLLANGKPTGRDGGAEGGLVAEILRLEVPDNCRCLLPAAAGLGAGSAAAVSEAVFAAAGFLSGLARPAAPDHSPQCERRSFAFDTLRMLQLRRKPDPHSRGRPPTPTAAAHALVDTFHAAINRVSQQLDTYTSLSKQWTASKSEFTSRIANLVQASSVKDSKADRLAAELQDAQSRADQYRDDMASLRVLAKAAEKTEKQLRQANDELTKQYERAQAALQIKQDESQAYTRYLRSETQAAISSAHEDMQRGDTTVVSSRGNTSAELYGATTIRRTRQADQTARADFGFSPVLVDNRDPSPAKGGGGAASGLDETDTAGIATVRVGADAAPALRRRASVSFHHAGSAEGGRLRPAAESPNKRISPKRSASPAPPGGTPLLSRHQVTRTGSASSDFSQLKMATDTPPASRILAYIAELDEKVERTLKLSQHAVSAVSETSTFLS